MIATEDVADLTSADGLAAALGLNRGDVASVQVSSRTSRERASLAFLEVEYAGATSMPPTRLVLKKKPPLVAGAEPPLGTEADFYGRFAERLPSPPVVRCLAARESSDTSSGFVLLEDLGASFSEPRQAEMDFGPAIDALACIHAAFWEADDRPTWPRGNPTERLIRSHLKWVAARLPAFFDAAGDALGVDERRLYERLCSSGLRPWLRLLDGRGLTLVHGDAHVGNVLVHRQPEGASYLIDWERWRADVGARDLAFMLLCRPPSPHGEVTLLSRYLAQLEALGVRGYGWDDLWADYRLCCIRNLIIPVARHARGSHEEFWREELFRVLAAFNRVDGEPLL